MNKRIYVGNLSFQANDENLFGLFGTYGEVEFVKIVIDQMTGRKKGFAFIEMKEASDAEAAITSLDGREFMDRELRVSWAKQSERSPRTAAPRY